MLAATIGCWRRRHANHSALRCGATLASSSFAAATARRSAGSRDGPRVPLSLVDAEDAAENKSDEVVWKGPTPETTVVIKRSGKKHKKMEELTADDIFSDLLAEAISNKEKGVPMKSKDIHQRVNEKMYEARHGRKLPSKFSEYEKSIPQPPSADNYRLEPQVEFENDPWAARRMRTRFGDPPYDEAGTIAAFEASVNDGNVVSLFCDAVEELGHWQMRYINFVRTVPLWQRRSLPICHEQYRLYIHRLMRAEKHYLSIRDRAIAAAKASTDVFDATEKLVDLSHQMIVESAAMMKSRALDPTKQKGSLLAKIARFNDEEYKAWLDEVQQQRNGVLADLM